MYAHIGERKRNPCRGVNPDLRLYETADLYRETVGYRGSRAKHRITIRRLPTALRKGPDHISLKALFIAACVRGPQTPSAAKP